MAGWSRGEWVGRKGARAGSCRACARRGGGRGRQRRRGGRVGTNGGEGGRGRAGSLPSPPPRKEARGRLPRFKTLFSGCGCLTDPPCPPPTCPATLPPMLLPTPPTHAAVHPTWAYVNTRRSQGREEGPVGPLPLLLLPPPPPWLMGLVVPARPSTRGASAAAWRYCCFSRRKARYWWPTHSATPGLTAGAAGGEGSEPRGWGHRG